MVAIRQPASRIKESHKTILRRSVRPENNITPGAETAAIMPGIVILRPAVPGLTENVLEISGRIPTGKNSVVTEAKDHNAKDRTASF
ncbi:hypothetical protein ACI01nite_19170 [Acetobacter cibinongensis]|uniref:Uncharacterized protein n=1 Tax=Acetobacter cibinongensis TaxID=146475 RepID=A0A0D6N1C3_9PROT|nr:hypothetical protein Abci_007_195 [Acetobacter cibinongensis]GEL59315.1 hypothetical protein ACI01nite_19170 [Acetobacter cibinongensis]